MLARYKVHRGRRPADDPLPEGIRQDTRKHTKHVVRPDAEEVRSYLDGETSWNVFAKHYVRLLERRYARDRQAFDKIAALATSDDVYLGCNCPTAKNPDVGHCHTVLALAFMQERYPNLDVRFPQRR